MVLLTAAIQEYGLAIVVSAVMPVVFYTPTTTMTGEEYSTWLELKNELLMFELFFVEELKKSIYNTLLVDTTFSVIEEVEEEGSL